MRTFIITSKNTTSEIVISYRDDGLISSFRVDTSTNENQLRWLLRTLPVHVDGIKTTFQAISNFKVIEAPIDLSFENFWKTYDKKVGKLKMTQNTWAKMPKKDKAKALGYIATYNSQCIREGVTKAYPSTYLNQRYFDA